MLGKLLRYEFKSTLRVFLPLYGAILFLALINKAIDLIGIRFEASIAWPAGIAMATYIFLIIATFVLTIIVTVQRFYKNLLSSEGYLMNTLPVKSWALLLSKGLIALFWIAKSLGVVLVSILILTYEKNLLRSLLYEIQGSWETFLAANGGQGVLLLIEILVLFLTSAVMALLMIYLAMAIGNLSSKNKVGASFGAYVLLYLGGQVISAILVVVVTQTNLLEYYGNLGLAYALPWLILYQLLYIGVYFYVTERILSRHLNLE